ncbi:MAG TPA: rod shape-determining protein MreC [Candidatus Paceibacterota bacterium]|nr:rod shape-determining protein MreC [Candidatus Paceibacterota bacterium]
MRYLYATILLSLTFALFAYGHFTDLKFKSSSAWGDILTVLIPGENLKLQVYELTKENESLKAEIIGSVKGGSNSIKVYSTYPFNGMRDISIAAGESDGVQSGAVITFGSKVFIGKVVQVNSSTSIVKTVYDPSYQVAVRIGTKEVDGLFKGGLNPIVDLIKTDADIREGDEIITASPDLPYGLFIGTVRNITQVQGAPFKQAKVELGVELSSLRDVSIYR